MKMILIFLLSFIYNLQVSADKNCIDTPEIKLNRNRISEIKYNRCNYILYFDKGKLTNYVKMDSIVCINNFNMHVICKMNDSTNLLLYLNDYKLFIKYAGKKDSFNSMVIDLNDSLSKRNHLNNLIFLNSYNGIYKAFIYLKDNYTISIRFDTFYNKHRIININISKLFDDNNIIFYNNRIQRIEGICYDSAVNENNLNIFSVYNPFIYDTYILRKFTNIDSMFLSGYIQTKKRAKVRLRDRKKLKKAY